MAQAGHQWHIDRIKGPAQHAPFPARVFRETKRFIPGFN